MGCYKDKGKKYQIRRFEPYRSLLVRKCPIKIKFNSHLVIFLFLCPNPGRPVSYSRGISLL